MAFSPMNYYPGYTGEQSYDPYAVETEEERRRREEEERLRIERETPVKQTIEIDPTTGAQKVKIEGSAYNLSSANPMTPTVSGPAVPEGVQVAGPADAAFQRMRQVESGNRDYDEQGRPVTSSKGAMFASQVMPSTAANPGYGVAPAQSQTPEEYNRVGREYYDAMLKKFGGDERLAQAAYNAGPGRVDQAVQVATAQGGDALQYLPKETQQYTQKVAAVSPEQMAQQQQMAQAPAQQPQGVPGVNMGGGTVSTAQAAANQGQAAPPPTFEQQFDAAQNDLNSMRKLMRSAPPQYQTAIEDRVIELAKREKAQAEVRQRVSEAVASGDMRGLTKEMNKNTTEGSLMKAFLLKTFGMEEAAQKESAKALGTDVKFTSVVDPETGRSSLIGVDRFTGMPVKGYDDTGISLTPQQLAKVGSMGKGNYDIVGGTYVNDKTGEIGRVITDKNNPQNQWIQTASGKTPFGPGWRPQSSQGSLNDMRSRLIQEANIKLQGKAGEEAMAIQREYNQKLVASGYAPMQPGETPINAPQIGGGAVAPTTVAPAAGGAAVAPVNPAAQAGAVAGANAAAGAAPTFPQVGAGATTPRAAGSRPTGPELDASAAARKDIVKPAAEQIAVSADTQNMLNSIKKVDAILDSGKHNIGSELSVVAGRGPIAQAIGSQFETKDAKNTKLVLDTVNKLAADGLKILGSNPSGPDLKFWTENKPNGSTDPDVMKEWIASRAADMKRRLNYAEKQVGTGGGAGAAGQVYPEKEIDGVTYVYDGKGWKKK